MAQRSCVTVPEPPADDTPLQSFPSNSLVGDWLFFRDDTPDCTIWDAIRVGFQNMARSFKITSLEFETVRGQMPSGMVLDEVQPFIVNRQMYLKLQEINTDLLGIALYDWSDTLDTDTEPRVKSPSEQKRKNRVCPRHGREMKGGFCRQCSRGR